MTKNLLDKTGGNTKLGKTNKSAGGVYRVAETDTAIDNERQTRPGSDSASHIGDLGVAQQSFTDGVLKAKGSTAQVTGPQACFFDQPRRKRI